MKKLGINIDHVATLRNARGESHPDIIEIAKIAKKSGADSITVHLREDRRHIKDHDLRMLCKKNFFINLEIASNLKMMKIAIKNKPKFVCLVPEKRNEITTEGGLNLKKNYRLIKKIINKLNQNKTRTSLFIDPTINNLMLSQKIGSNCVELHTGKISRLKQDLNILHYSTNSLDKQLYNKSIKHIPIDHLIFLYLPVFVFFPY